MSEVLTVPQRRKAFTTLFLVEMWERFGYYGMQTLIIYYMIQHLGFDDTRANLVTSAAAALLYAAPAVGGYIGDRWFGTQRCVWLGVIMLALGYALLAIPSSSALFMIGAQSVIIVGNGFFKSNSGSMLSRIYEGDDKALDSASTLYYMAVNVGSMVSILLTPAIKVYVNEHYGDGLGWHAAFACCALGLLIGLMNMLVMRRSLRPIHSEHDNHPVSLLSWVAVLGIALVMGIMSMVVLWYTTLAAIVVGLLTAAVVVVFAVMIYCASSTSRAGVTIAAILTLQSMLFFIFYQQILTSLSLFALRNTNLDTSLFGIHLWRWSDPAQFEALNAIWIMVLSPVLAWIYTTLEQRRKGIPTPVKFLFGFVAVAIGFAIFGSAEAFAVDGYASSWLMIIGYGFYSLSELLISGLGIAVMSRYIPAHSRGFMIGIYFVATGLTQYVGGAVANLASIPEDIKDPLVTLPIYSHFFMQMCIVAIICCVLTAMMLPWLLKLQRRCEQG